MTCRHYHEFETRLLLFRLSMVEYFQISQGSCKPFRNELVPVAFLHNTQSICPGYYLLILRYVDEKSISRNPPVTWLQSNGLVWITT